MKQDILEKILEAADQGDQETLNTTNGMTTDELANKFNIKRNTMSRYLNELVNSDDLVKINSRPVYFYDRKFVTRLTGNAQLADEYDSFEDINCSHSTNNIFDNVIGSESSLHLPVEQLISAAVYPNGLPVLLHGKSGTGKSLLARLMYRYCVKAGIVSKSAPFIVFNCAQYFDNPELLSSQLFGYKKGAFTGAEENHPGIIEAADNGILFLDEVHRLSPEGQEKLFVLMDQGIFSRIGETGKIRKVKVRLVFATTEKLKDQFLPTFLRRIPIICQLPSFSERTYSERKELVYHMFQQEAKALSVSVKVSTKVIKTITSAKFDGNIGAVENLVKQACAKEFSRQYQKNPITVNSASFSNEFIIQQTDSFPEYINEPVLFQPNMKISFSEEVTLVNQLYQQFLEQTLQAYESMKENNISYNEFTQNVIQGLRYFIDEMIFNDTNTSQKLINYLIQSLQEVFYSSNRIVNDNISGNGLFMISNYLLRKESIQNNTKDREAIYQLYHFLEVKLNTNIFPIFQLLENNLDMSLNYMDKIYIMLVIMMETQKKVSSIGGLIIAHGYATASSIGSVVNRLLGTPIFASFDMPLDIKIEELAEHLREYVRHSHAKNGLVILVDMGSLYDIGKQLIEVADSPLLLINNVSTSMALGCGEMIQNGDQISEISENMKDVGKISSQIILPPNHQKHTIIISCSTGLGVAVKLKEIFEKVVPEQQSLNFIAIDYHHLKNKVTRKKIFQDNNVIGIIGTTLPKGINVPYISIDDLFSGKDNRLYQLLVSYLNPKEANFINDELVKKLSLKKIIDSLTILDSQKIMTEIEKCLNKLEKLLTHKFTNNQKLSLYVHLSCMVERLIRNQPIETAPNRPEFLHQKDKFINIIKTACGSLEELYNINITENEIQYIFDIVYSDL